MTTDDRLTFLEQRTAELATLLTKLALAVTELRADIKTAATR